MDGRTGLTALIVGVLFLATMFVAPSAQLVTADATAPALILVGGMTMRPLAEVEWGDPAFLTKIVIPLTFAIATRPAVAVVSYAVLKLVTRQASRRDWLLYELARPVGRPGSRT